MQRIPLFHVLTMANGSYFQFDEDYKIQYKYSHNHHKKNRFAEYTQTHILHER